jgi:hypothetical protein
MSAYVTRKNAVVAALKAELGISLIHASELQTSGSSRRTDVAPAR